ncbi:MAG: hypothetical protein HC875_23215 [Anaerolineales bacterium]|nr:hypothetical protein [Anaerolineales bacterium]
MLRWWIIIGLVVVTLTGGWFWRNYSLYGEWLVTEPISTWPAAASFPWPKSGNCAPRRNEPSGPPSAGAQIRPPEWVYRLLFIFSRVGW